MSRKYFKGEIKELRNNQVFVFGSNLAGRHGRGAAKIAKENFGAVYGIGKGLTGDCYALPTKDFKVLTLSLSSIEMHIDEFIRFAKWHLDFEFLVTEVGTGLAGYSPEVIAPLFKDAPSNCVFSENWKQWLN